VVYRVTLEKLVLLLSPFVPHISEELWVELGHQPGVMQAPWPACEEAALTADTVEVVLQINGKVRGKIELPAGASREEMEKSALDNPQVQKHLAGLTVKKIIVVPGKLVNVAAG